MRGGEGCVPRGSSPHHGQLPSRKGSAQQREGSGARGRQKVCSQVSVLGKGRWQGRQGWGTGVHWLLRLLSTQLTGGGGGTGRGGLSDGPNCLPEPFYWPGPRPGVPRTQPSKRRHLSSQAQRPSCYWSCRPADSWAYPGHTCTHVFEHTDPVQPCRSCVIYVLTETYMYKHAHVFVSFVCV